MFRWPAWHSIEGLSGFIRFATWGIVGTLLLGGVVTAVTIIADKKREKLQKPEELRREAEIADAKKKAGEANERAGLANERAGKAEENAGRANERASEANKRAEELKLQNLATEERLEQERSQRLEM